ncbi:MAG: alkaline shock response membrane anchor protein AmaP [Oscillospiraceae bacterium]|jgi:uncharacterized alkaline shock family protein YloU|nr:alkaline shock response membrane anchor protein AmaP [Oscillospiraceae bacterium]
MTLKWYDRALIALSGLVLAALGVLLALLGSGLLSAEAFGLDIWLGTGWQWMPILCAAGALLMAWGLRLIWRQLIPARGGAYYSLGGAGEAGGVQIAVQALDHLVRKSLGTHPEILTSHIRIGGREDAMQITLRLTLRTGVRIPALVAQVRQEIKAYVEDCAGVTVQQIEIIVESTKDPRGGEQDAEEMPRYTYPRASHRVTTWVGEGDEEDGLFPSEGRRKRYGAPSDQPEPPAFTPPIEAETEAEAEAEAEEIALAPNTSDEEEGDPVNV